MATVRSSGLMHKGLWLHSAPTTAPRMFLSISPPSSGRHGNLREGQKLNFELERGQQGKTSAVNLRANRYRRTLRAARVPSGARRARFLEDMMAGHKFTIGQAVHFSPDRRTTARREAATRSCGCSPKRQHAAIPHQSKTDGHERVVRETQLEKRTA